MWRWMLLGGAVVVAIVAIGFVVWFAKIMDGMLIEYDP